MANYLQRARSAIHEFLRGAHAAPAETPQTVEDSGPPVVVGDNLVVAGGRLSFANPGAAAADPLAWLNAFDAAVSRGVALSDGVLAVARDRAARLVSVTSEESCRRLLVALRPRAGLSARLQELYQGGVLAALFPESRFSTRAGRDGTGGADEPHALAGIRTLERLLSEPALLGERFGSLLRELSTPELLTLALLLHDAGPERQSPDPDQAARVAAAALDRLCLSPSARRIVEFLIRNQLQMSMMALRQDTGDPAVVARFAALFDAPSQFNRELPEEHLKMLALVTVADLSAMGADMLTPWKAELLWRLFVDTYNHMTMSYGDEVIDHDETTLTALKANRPHDVSEVEMDAFLEGLPRRYLTLFEPESIYEHARLARDMHQQDVHFFLARKQDAWELTVATLDKPFLFSNICGVLSYFGFDILRGHALTSRTGLVLDIFQFTDHKGCLLRPQLDPLLSEVVAGRADITTLLQERARSAPAETRTHTPPVIYFDNDFSNRYTILELVADDAPGLLHRISRVISSHGCVVDLVLISTEAGRAYDVFHMRQDGGKLSDSDELALTQDFERALADAQPGSASSSG